MLSKKEKLVIAKRFAALIKDITSLNQEIKSLGEKLDLLESRCCKTKAIGSFVEIEPDGHQSNGEKLDDRLI